MKTVSRVYDTYAQASDAVTAVEASGVPSERRQPRRQQVRQ